MIFFQGCKEGVDPFVKAPAPWSAFQSDDYGYTIMKVANKTHLLLSQISVDQVDHECSCNSMIYDAKYHSILIRVGLSLTLSPSRRTFTEWVPMTATSSMNSK